MFHEEKKKTQTDRHAETETQGKRQKGLLGLGLELQVSWIDLRKPFCPGNLKQTHHRKQTTLLLIIREAVLTQAIRVLCCCT